MQQQCSICQMDYVLARYRKGGQVRIITEDRRVLERVFGQLRDLLKNR